MKQLMFDFMKDDFNPMRDTDMLFDILHDMMGLDGITRLQW
tara:strand:- start:648 stop:770 length:123 start_codon:yes stop_codon:yes gene_type:complete